MHTEDIKTILENFYEIKIEKTILEQALSTQDDKYAQYRLKNIEAQLIIYNTLMDSLNTDEKFIIRQRFFCKKKWNDVINFYEETFGREYAKSERTLKQIQANALSKIQLLIIKTNASKYLFNMSMKNAISN